MMFSCTKYKKSFILIFEVMNVENTFQAHFRMWSADEEFKGDLQTRHKYRQIWGAVGGRDSAHPGTGVYKGGGGQYTGQSGQYTEMVIVATRHCPATECRAELGGGAVDTWLQGLALVPSHHCRSPQTLSKPHRSAPTLKFCVTDCKMTMRLSNRTEAASWNIQFQVKNICRCQMSRKP